MSDSDVWREKAAMLRDRAGETDEGLGVQPVEHDTVCPRLLSPGKAAQKTPRPSAILQRTSCNRPERGSRSAVTCAWRERAARLLTMPPSFHGSCGTVGDGARARTPPATRRARRGDGWAVRRRCQLAAAGGLARRSSSRFATPELRAPRQRRRASRARTAFYGSSVRPQSGSPARAERRDERPRGDSNRRLSLAR
jgi:hypothetical protein